MLREFPELRQTAAPNHYAKLLCQTRPHHDLRHVAHDEDEDNECGQPEREPAATPAREFHAVAGVGLGEEVVPAPAPARHAEHHVQEATQRQEVVRHDEVLDGLNVADARNGDAGKHVEAQGAGQAQHGDEHGGAREGALAVETPFLHGEGDEVLEDGR